MGGLFALVLGFLGGVVISRNAEPMQGASVGAVVLGLVAGCGLCWFFGYRGKSSAVATAVASATATATAAAEAQAHAIASAAVHLHMQSAPDAPYLREGFGSGPEPALLEVAHPSALDSAETGSARLWVPAARSS